MNIQSPGKKKKCMLIRHNGRIQTSKIWGGGGVEVGTKLYPFPKKNSSEQIGSLAAPAAPLLYTLGKKILVVISDCLFPALLHATLKTSFISH